MRRRERLGIALAFSLAFHALILSLQFGAPGYGLPGLAWPWAERRVQAPSFTVRLAEAPRAPAPVPPPVVVPVPPVAATAKPPKPAQPSRAGKSFEVRPPRAARAPAAKPLSRPQRETVEPAPAGKTRAREREIRPQPQPEIVALSDPQEETFSVPSPGPDEPEQQRAPETAARTQPEEPPPAVQETEQAEEERLTAEEARVQAEEAARLQAESAARRRAEEDTRERALALQQQLDAEQKEQEARRLAEARKREEASKQEEEERRRKAEADRRKEEEERQEEARRIAQEADALKRAEEAARRQTADGGAPAAAPPAPGALSGRELAARALDQARTPGALTDPPRPPSRPAQPASVDGMRRRSILGAERDITLRMYADSWRGKIERNAPINFPAWASRRARDYPVVTVAIRRDGSLEDIIIHRSSGLRELDEAVRRIVRFYAPYSAFPPALARQYDVIEIRRVWYFEDTLRIRDEL